MKGRCLFIYGCTLSSSPHSTSWDDFRLVRAIAETGSLTGAAEKLGLNHSTVFRRLGQLEETLGTRLFERSRNRYATTGPGEEMVTLASRMGEEIDAFERRAAGRDEKPTGELHITTTDSMLVYLLTPVLASFCKIYPDIKLDIIVGNQQLNLSRRDADIALRASTEPSETLVGRRIADMNWARYGVADYPFHWEDPAARWAGLGDSMSGTTINRLQAQKIDRTRIFYRVNTMLGLTEAIQAGIGIGILPCFIGDKVQGLVRLTQPPPNNGQGLWLLTHPDLRHAARIRAFMDHAGAELVKRRKQITGER